MIQFQCDYSEGAHEKIMKKMLATNMEQTKGYGCDPYCERAKELIKSLCKTEDVEIHFVVGGTQANLMVISAALRTYQGILCAETGHINVHETGAIEATGHKVLPLPSSDGKITAAQVRHAYLEHVNNDSREHTVQPKMVYISNPTELGTLYKKEELEELNCVCHECGMYLFLDGARLVYGLAAEGNDLELPDLAQLCDIFYIGGTKAGALFGEAIVLCNHELRDGFFRYYIKQRGGMLAKGRLLGIQFQELLSDGLYLELGSHANKLAMKIKDAFTKKGFSFLTNSNTNQQFVILPEQALLQLDKEFIYTLEKRMDSEHSAVRFCTSWATKKEDVAKLISAIEALY